MRHTDSRGEGKGRQGAKVRSFAGLINVGFKLMLPEPAVGHARRRRLELSKVAWEAEQAGATKEERQAPRGWLWLGETMVGPRNRAKRREQDWAARRVVESHLFSSNTLVMSQQQEHHGAFLTPSLCFFSEFVGVLNLEKSYLKRERGRQGFSRGGTT